MKNIDRRFVSRALIYMKKTLLRLKFWLLLSGHFFILIDEKLVAFLTFAINLIGEFLDQ